MQEVILEPRKYAKGKYLRISYISVEWDEGRRAFAAMIMFYRTRGRTDSKPLGAVLYANNVETLVKMLQEYNLLYPVQKKTTIGIPGLREKIRCISHTGYIHPYIENTEL